MKSNLFYWVCIPALLIWSICLGASHGVFRELRHIVQLWQTPLIVLAFILVAKPTSFIIGRLLKRYTKVIDLKAQPGLEEAGRFIGYLERWMILTFFILGQYTGIGFLLAAKSIFRFGDLSQTHQRQLTEYMLLGTLFSFFAAILVGWLLVLIIG